MKLSELWEQIGRQPSAITDRKDAIVFVSEGEYKITKIRYSEGKIAGLEVEPRYQWFSEMIKPEIGRFVVVKDDNGKEYNNHKWDGRRWNNYVINHDNSWHGCESGVNIFSWKYQEDVKEINLKPCPFCGGQANMIKRSLFDGPKKYYVECGIEFGFCPVLPESQMYDTEQDAADAWNKRY